jgi:hypothetical protein
MRHRAIIWCGMVRDGRKTPKCIEQTIFRHDIELTIRAARARGVRAEDIWALVCDPSLMPTDFAGQVHGARVSALHEVASGIARTATDNDCLLFVATNHCEHPDGLLMECEPADEFKADEDLDDPVFLSPARLAQQLEMMPGRQLVVIATCFAGLFVSMATEHRAIFAACAERQLYRWKYGIQEPPRSPFLYELLSRWAGVSLANYESPEPRSMIESFSDIESEYPGCVCNGSARWADDAMSDSG